jgi:hypothetical protein
MKVFPPKTFLIQVNSIDSRLAEMQELQEIELIEEAAGLKGSTTREATPEMSGSFMSESVYGKLNSPKARKRRAMRIFSIYKTDKRTNIDASVAETSCSRVEYSGITFRLSF